MKNYNFDVDCKQAGQLRPYGASIYHYIITDNSEIPYKEFTMKNFCTKFLRHGVPKDKMEHPFEGEIKIFRQNEDKTWEYQVREESTH